MEKNEIFYKSFGVILSKGMESENLQANFCEDDGDYRVYGDICVKLCIDRFYKNHLKSQSHTNIICNKKSFINKYEILL